MYRLSPTLLDSFAYYLSIQDEEQSLTKRQELIDYLNGKKVESEIMQAGQDFERAVYLASLNEKQTFEDERYADCVKEIASEICGGCYQWHAERMIGDVQVHGYIDFMKFNRIYDIKTTKDYEVGKYRDRIQHRIYLYCMQEEQIRNFSYLVTDFRNVYREDYSWIPSYEDDIKTSIDAFFSYLDNDSEMKQAYENKTLLQGKQNVVQPE